MATDRRPRGIRNHNPGNIDRTSPRTPWQGRVPDSQLTDPRFEQFTAPEWGIRAMAKTLITYQDHHGLRTVRGIIRRWAPPGENRTEAYVLQVANAMGVHPEQQLNVQDYAVMRPLVEAIIRVENGQQPYARTVIDEGLRRAGVVPARPPSAVKDRELLSGALSGGSMAAEIFGLQHQLAAVAPYSPDTIGKMLGFLAIAGAVWFVVERYQARQRAAG